MNLPEALTSIPVLAAIGAVALVLVVALVFLLVRRRRRARRPAVEAHPPPEFSLHAVPEGIAEQLHGRWETLQRDFVDAPADTLRRADALVVEAMRERGYPAADADTRARLLREHEPAHAARYDQLRRAIEDTDDRLDTEARRQVLLHARTLFDALLRDGPEGQPRIFAA